MLRRRKIRVRGSALIITVVISLIILILISSIILLGSVNRKYQSVFKIENRLQNNLESAMSLILADTSLKESSASIDLFSSGTDSVYVKKELWGLYQLASARAHLNRFAKEVSFLYGSPLPSYMDGCIYMADHQKPLSIVGKTKLTGDVFISNAGLQASYIDQRGFEYAALLSGHIKQSQKYLPPIRQEGTDYLYNLLDTSKIDIDHVVLPDSLHKSFSEPPVVLVAKAPIYIDNRIFKGHIIIKSGEMIHVSARNELNDIILVAPFVKIDSGFRGTIQVIASKELETGADCHFDYPSSLVLLKGRQLHQQSKLTFGSRSVLQGHILTLCDSKDDLKTLVELAGAVTGITYVSGYLSVKAPINGVVLTDYFVHRTLSNVYENYLVDVDINRKNLSAFFISTPFFESNSQRGIVQWLD